MLEVETLGPMTQLSPNGSAAQSDDWYIFRADVGEYEASIDRTLTPLIQQTSAPK